MYRMKGINLSISSSVPASLKSLLGSWYDQNCAYHPAAQCSNPKHTIYAFFNLYYWNCNEIRTKITKREAGIGPLLQNTGARKEQRPAKIIKKKQPQIYSLKNQAFIIWMKEFQRKKVKRAACTATCRKLWNSWNFKGIAEASASAETLFTS